MKPCGIYLWKNLITGRVLVGQAGHTTGFEVRRKQYLKRLRKNIHQNKHFQRSWNKHGEPNFVFETLEHLPIGKMTTRQHREALTDAEQAWIDYYRDFPEGVYNKNNPIDPSRRGAVVPEETRRKLSELMKGKPAWNKGVPMTDEAKRKMSDSHKGVSFPEDRKRRQSERMLASGGTFLGKTHTEEAREKISKANIGKHTGPLSEEHKKKISEAQKGIPKGPVSEEAKEKISKKLLGVPKSAEHAENISKARTGTHHSDEVKKKMSDSAKSREPMSSETKEKMSRTRKGRSWSDKRRAAHEASKFKGEEL